MNFKKKHLNKKHQSGFTLVETVIAILILSLSIGSLLSLAAGGFFSVRYARNQIVADNLAQEALEYIRNSRDTAVQQGTSWNTWLQTLNVDTNGQPVGLGSPSGCFATAGCRVDPYTSGQKIVACSSTCPVTILYPTEGFYGYQSGTYPFSGGAAPLSTSYVRTVKVSTPVTDQLVITVTTRWLNGTREKTVTQSTMVTNWNI